MSTVTFGKTTVGLDDFVRVVTGEAKLVINSASLGEMQKAHDASSSRSGSNSSGSSGRVPFIPEADVTGERYHVRVSRGLVAARILSLLDAQTCISPDVITFLTDLLNNQSIDVRLSFHFPLKSLASHYLHPTNNNNHESKTTTTTNSANIPVLTQQEYEIFISNQSESLFFASRLALYAHEGQELSDLADCVAALSCEAIQASSLPFGSYRQEICRPHKSSILVSDHLNLLLENSQEINHSKRKEKDPSVISSIPDIHGGVKILIDNVYRFAKVELNSTQLSESCAFSPVAINKQLHILDQAMSILWSSSLDRIQALLDLQRTLEYPLTSDCEHFATGRLAELRGAHVGPFVVLSMARGALSLEAYVACELLAVKETNVIKIATEKEIEKKKRQAEYEAKSGKAGSVNKKKGEKEGVAGEEKKGGLILGKGTQLFRTYLLRESNSSSNNTNVFASCMKALNGPLSLQDSFFLNDILTSTNQICKPKLPKGTRDSEPEQMSIREKAFSIIKRVFQNHGAVGIDTPVFERKEVLSGKYGEDSKLIYDLADQGGEMLSLRYDLTVPFARYVASNGVTHIKRYHMGRVYRRDAPAMKSGRFREFYQCDFDVAGSYARMVPDAEVIKVLCDVLVELQLGNFKVKFNHRQLLDALMDVCGVPAQKFRSICSAIDKLDKTPWAEVRTEMVAQKGLDPVVADKLEGFVTRKPKAGDTPRTVLAELRAVAAFSQHKAAQDAFADLDLAFTYMEALGCLQYVSFDMSLARGLDYYTGVIYEAVLTDTNQVGSIAAGGRYDNLVGMFSTSPVPAVGVSIGIERIFTILEQLERTRGSVRATQTQVLVASVGQNLLEQRMELTALLWRNKINAEFLYDTAPAPNKQMDYASESGIPFVLWIGEDEIAKGIVKVRDATTRTQEDVPRDQLLPYLISKLNNNNNTK